MFVEMDRVHTHEEDLDSLRRLLGDRSRLKRVPPHQFAASFDRRAHRLPRFVHFRSGVGAEPRCQRVILMAETDDVDAIDSKDGIYVLHRERRFR